RLSILRHLVSGRNEGDSGGALRGGRGRRRHDAAALPSRHVAEHPQHHDHRRAALHDLDVQRLPDRLHPHQGRTGRHHHGDAGADVRDGVRRPALGRGDRGGALSAARARRDDHGARALHAPGPPSMSTTSRAQTVFAYAVLVTLAELVLLPLYWMTITSVKSEDQMRSLVSMFWPRPLVGDNYGQLLSKTDFVAWYGNSATVAIASTLLATAVGTIGAYALARLRFRGRGFLASATLITYLVPPSILFIPLYAQMRNLGLANSLGGLIAAYPSFTVPFVTWLLMGYFESIPEELEEAAMIDGATRFGAFSRVVLPLAAP